MSCMKCLLKKTLSCLSFLCCSVMCCECNCVIFPGPHQDIVLDEEALNDMSQLIQLGKFQQNQNVLPYLKISSKRQTNKIIIYFHGNAEDLSSTANFLLELSQQMDVIFYAMEYPGYGSYKVNCPAMISNTIKNDSLRFYDFVKKRNQKSIGNPKIIVMGRSIGSGGACYLAANRQIDHLILMSPFDTIRDAAINLVGCFGCLVKQHFNNVETIQGHKGRLLVIHGMADQVLSVQGGKRLAKIYQEQTKTPPIVLYPQRMTHNNFHMKKDIINPINQFLRDVK